nr:lysosomal trafficking regulator [Hymenolepis microstoma]
MLILLTKICIWVWKHLSKSDTTPYFSIICEVIVSLSVAVEKALTANVLKSDDSSHFILLSFAQCLNMLVLALPVQLPSDDLTDLVNLDALHRLIRIKNLLSSPSSSIFLEYFMISCRFATRLSPKVSKVCLDNFSSKSLLIPLLNTQYAEIVPVCLSLVHLFLAKSFCIEGLNMLKELVDSIISCDKPEMIQHFIRLMFIGKPSLISLISRSKVTPFLKSFFYQCIQLCIPICDRIPAQYLNFLMDLYLKAVQIDIKDRLDLSSLKKLFSPYLDMAYNLSVVTSSQRDSVFVVQLISTRVLRISASNKIQNAMLRYLVCPILNSVQLDDPGQISLAFDFASAFIRLLTNISEPELIDLITDTLSALNHIILITDVSLPCLKLITCAFVDYLTSPMSCPSNMPSSFSEIFKTVLINFLQLLLRCVETDKSGIPSDCRSFAWTALCNVLSQSPDLPIVLIHQDKQLYSILCRLTQFAEVHFRASNEFPYDFDPILIGVLLELYLQMKRKSSLESLPLNFTNSAFIDKIISFCCDKSQESPEILEPLEKVTTLSVPMSYYLTTEKQLCYSSSKKHLTLLFFVFWRFLNICDLSKPNHHAILHKFIREIVQLRSCDLIYVTSTKHSELKIWFSDLVSSTVNLLKSEDLQKGSSLTLLIIDLLEFLCMGNLFPLVQVAPVQFKGILQLVLETKSSVLQLRIIRLLTKWSRNMDPLEPDECLAWPRYINLPLFDHPDTAENTSTVRMFGFVRSSISLSHWQQGSNQIYPPSVLSKIWPSGDFSLSEDSMEFPGSTSTCSRDSSGLTVSLWHKMLPTEQNGEFTDSDKLSKSTLFNLASRSELLHLFTLEESIKPESSLTPPSTLQSIEVWMAPSAKGIYTRIYKEYDSFISSSETLVPNVLTSSNWSHLLINITFSKRSGKISIVENASTYREETFHLESTRRRMGHFHKFQPESHSLNLWIGHNSVVYDEVNSRLKTPTLYTNGLHVFTGAVLSRLSILQIGGETCNQLKELALYLAICGPNNSWDAWTGLLARGRCYLNALMERLDPKDIADVFTRGQRILTFEGVNQCVRTLKMLKKHHLLVRADFSNVDGAIWTVRISPFRRSAFNESSQLKSGDLGVHSGSFEIVSKFKRVNSLSGRDIDGDNELINLVTKYSIESAISPLGGIDSALFLAGVIATSDNADSGVIEVALDFILTLRRQSAILAEYFFRTLLEESIPLSSNEAFNRLHITSYGLCLLSTLFNQINIKYINPALQEIVERHVFLKVAAVDNDRDDAHLLIDPELLACYLSFSSILTLHQTLLSLTGCMKRGGCCEEVVNQISMCNVNIIDQYQIIEISVIAFRIRSSAGFTIDDTSDQDYAATLGAIAQLISRRLLFSSLPPPASLLNFLLWMVVSVDPDLYHSAVTRVFGYVDQSSTSSTAHSTLNLVELASKHNQNLQWMILSPQANNMGKVPEKVEGFVEEPEVQTHSPFTEPKSIPLIPLQPALILEGASVVEAETLAKFREQLMSDENGVINDRCNSSIMFSSCYNLPEFEDLGLLKNKSYEESSTLKWRSYSLPDISSSMVKNVYLSEDSATLDRLASPDATKTPSECAIYSQTSSIDPLSISPLRLVQRHQLAAVILSTLVEFWQKQMDRIVLEMTSISYPRVPPFWLVYYLAGHPCTKFREYALALYNKFLKSRLFQRRENSDGKSRILTMQFLSASSSLVSESTHHLDSLHCSTSNFAHASLTSPELVIAASKLLNDQVATPDKVSASTSITMAIFASALVDIVTFFKLRSETISNGKINENLNIRWKNFHESFTNFCNNAKTNTLVLISLHNSFSLQILLEMVHYLQTSCPEIEVDNLWAVRFHEIGHLVSRLLSSTISKVKVRVPFQSIQTFIRSLLSIGDNAALNRPCVIREVLLRILFTLLDQVIREFANQKNCNVPLLQLQWTVETLEKALLYKGSSLPFNPLTTGGQNFRCSQFPTVQGLEQALITLLISSTSYAMHNLQGAVWTVLSNSLLRAAWTWCDALFETLTISKPGLRLIQFLATEPQIISQEAINANTNMIIGLKDNLEMLVAVFSVGPQNNGRNEDFGVEDYLGNLSDSLSVLFEWITGVCSKIRSSEKVTSPCHPSDEFSVSTSTFPSLNLIIFDCDWLTPLREMNYAGQRLWSTLVSQHHYIVDVLGPFYWMQLGGNLSHESSVFSSVAPKSSFSFIDTFENDSRQRCRRRPVIAWVDDRFVRTTSVRSLGQYQKMHPLSPLMMQHQTYTPSRGLARSRCIQIPHVLFPPSSQGLFFPPPTPHEDKCIGVWPCYLIELADSIPLEGDLSLDASWIHLFINNVNVTSPREAQIGNETLIHGIGEYSGQKGVVTFPLRSIAHVEERRFELRDLALELFFNRMCNVPPVMIAFRSKKDRDHFLQTLVGACSALLPRHTSPWWRVGNFGIESGRRYPSQRLRDACAGILGPFSTPYVGQATRERLLDAQVAWLRGQMSNFDYLMALNSAAGRTYNDITQYPIFPWVIADYKSEILDLRKIQGTYRQLDRPISVQSEAVAATVIENYEDLKAQQAESHFEYSFDEEQRSILCPVYHYSSFCSNEAIVLHLLFRLIPFAFRLIQFQDGNFENPNRLFHSMAVEWAMATDSAKHVKELIPEFFFRSDLFTNYENFELGIRHDGIVVDGVELPPWSKGDPRLFVLINRAVLESPYVTAHLPEWIDLVFGYKQTGRAGERALNLYHPFTYFGAIDVDRIGDPVRRSAVQSMIRNYGQVPRQLFPTHPHPRRAYSRTLMAATGESAFHFPFHMPPQASQISGISRFVHQVISGFKREREDDNEEGKILIFPHSKVEPKIAIVKSLSVDECELESRSEVGFAASVLPLTAGTPLDTVRGLRWGDWAGNPRSPLGISWYTNLEGGSRSYCLRGDFYSFWTVLVSETSNYLFLLQHAHYPVLLVKISLQPHVITIKTRRFIDGVEMHSMNLSLSFAEPKSIFLAVPSVKGRPISESDVIHLLVGTSTGGLYARILTIKELLTGLESYDNDGEEAIQNQPHIHNQLSYSINYIQTPVTQRLRRPSLSSSTVSTSWRCLIGHIGSSISCLSACPPYGLMASGDDEGRVIIWDLVSMSYITLLDIDDSCALFRGVCGLAFDQKSGDLVVARSGPNGSFEIWIGLFTSECRQCSNRILDFQAEIGVTTKMGSPHNCDTRENLPIIFSPTRGNHVGCILIGGPNGCLVWLNSWTLDTISIMQLDQPSPCSIVALSFAPPSSSPMVHKMGDNDSSADSTLYVIDSEGWMYFLEPGVKLSSQRLRIQSNFLHQDSHILHLPGLWL